ncbi:MAG TPA: hypothetical protein VFF28_03240 [Candidatus Nanoarchaeia archaeon]|nr:hypothetical protein [Candidatus Nanoarchaeia archaeon]
MILNKLRIEDLVELTGSVVDARSEYQDMQNFWGATLDVNTPHRLFCRMFNPIVFPLGNNALESYRRLIVELAEDPMISGVSVYNNGPWRRLVKNGGYYEIIERQRLIGEIMKVSDLENDNKVRVMAAIAANDRYHYKYLEAVVGPKDHPNLNTTLSFTEYTKGQKAIVVGYELMFPASKAGLFRAHTSWTNYRLAYCLWVPDGYKDLPTPASQRKKIVI